MPTVEELLEKVLAIADGVARFGVSVVPVASGEDASGFAYTVGLHETCGQPEIIVSGLPPSVATQLLNDCASLMKDGHRFLDGQVMPGLLSGNYVCALKELPAERVNDLFGMAKAYYGHCGFRALQLVWPDKENKLPWQPGYEDLGQELFCQQPAEPMKS